MAVADQIIVTAVMILVSTLALLFTARTLRCNILIGDALVVAGTIEIIIVSVRSFIRWKPELVTLLVSIVVGIYLIKKMYREPWHKSAHIFFWWLVLRFIGSIVVGFMAGVVVAV